mgnify:CR=1 FL=1
MYLPKHMWHLKTCIYVLPSYLVDCQCFTTERSFVQKHLFHPIENNGQYRKLPIIYGRFNRLADYPCKVQSYTFYYFLSYLFNFFWISRALWIMLLWTELKEKILEPIFTVTLVKTHPLQTLCSVITHGQKYLGLASPSGAMNEYLTVSLPLWDPLFH